MTVRFCQGLPKQKELNMGMTIEFRIFELSKLPEDVVEGLDLNKFGTILDDKWLIVQNAEQWQEFNPYYALLAVMENDFGMEYGATQEAELKNVNCYLEEQDD